jgi:phage tail sheath protein FI
MPPIGLQVREVAGPSSPVLSPSDLSNVGAVVKSRIGPMNTPVLITSMKEYEEVFGTVLVGTPLYSFYEMRGLFLNAAPNNVNVYVVRPGTGGTAATLADGTNPNQITFTFAYYGVPSPGAEGNNFKVQMVSEGSAGYYTLNVYKTISGADALVETHSNLTTANIEGRVNTNSKYISVDVTGTYALTAIAKTSLATGADPTAPTNLSATEFSLLDNTLIQLLMCPDWNSTTDAQALEAYCAGRNDCLAVAAVPYAVTFANLGANWSSTMLTTKSFLAAYWNWSSVPNYVDGGSDVYTPGIGYVIGAYYIRQLFSEGGNAFVPPAGLRTSIRGIKRMQYDALTSGQIEQAVHVHGVNVVQFFSGYGIVCRTSRTMSSTSKFYSIHIRRSINYLVSTFRRSLGSFEQRPNNPDTRRQLKQGLDLFLFNEFQKGMFEKEGGYANNVRVTCDESNNGTLVRQNRQLVCDAYVNFAEVAETVYINVVQIVGGFDVNVI